MGVEPLLAAALEGLVVGRVEPEPALAVDDDEPFAGVLAPVDGVAGDFPRASFSWACRCWAWCSASMAAWTALVQLVLSELAGGEGGPPPGATSADATADAEADAESVADGEESGDADTDALGAVAVAVQVVDAVPSSRSALASAEVTWAASPVVLVPPVGPPPGGRLDGAEPDGADDLGDVVGAAVGRALEPDDEVDELLDAEPADEDELDVSSSSSWACALVSVAVAVITASCSGFFSSVTSVCPAFTVSPTETSTFATVPDAVLRAFVTPSSVMVPVWSSVCSTSAFVTGAVR